MAPPSNKSYHWVYTDEPHASRRKEILKKYPQITKLMGHDPTTLLVVFNWTVCQFAFAWLMRDVPYWVVLLVAYVYGGIASHALFMAMHEISHNLAFKSRWANVVLGYFANTSVGVPYISMFKRYHREHHSYQGIDQIDVDVPMQIEIDLFDKGPLHKAIWLVFQPIFYVLRPLVIAPKSPGVLDILNWVIILSSDALVLYYMGHKALLYLLLSSTLGSGLHPIAGHFIAEHYEFIHNQETYSYYGPLNFLIFNVGFHNEHHDFPFIPGSRLHLVKQMAPEYYDMPSYTSYFKVLYDFITDPKMGPHSRVVRKGSVDPSKLS